MHRHSGSSPVSNHGPWEQYECSTFFRNAKLCYDAALQYERNANKRHRRITLLDLNTDCLDVISSYLSAAERVRFTLATGLWIKLCRRNYLLPLAHLQTMELYELHAYLKLHGASIICIEGVMLHKNVEQIVALVSEYCCNVKMLKINQMILIEREDTIPKFVPRKKFKDMPKIQILALHGEVQALGGSLTEYRCLPELRELYLENCDDISLATFNKCLPLLRQLRVLEIQNSNGLINIDFHSLQQHCHNLQVLKITLNARIDYRPLCLLFSLRKLSVNCGSLLLLSIIPELSYLPQLVELDIDVFHDNTNVCQQIASIKQIKKLAYSVGAAITCDNFGHILCELENLEEFQLYNRFSTFSNAALVYFVERCKNIRRISLQGCRNVGNEFVQQVLKVLEKAERQHVLQLDVRNTGICEREILLHKDYLRHKRLLKLDFTTSSYRESNIFTTGPVFTY